MAEEALKIEENEELEVPTGGIGDFVMEDDEIEEVYGDDSEVDAKADFGDDGIAQFPALAERMAKYGRNEDNMLAHVAEGELVIPAQFLEDEVMKQRIFEILEEAGVEDPQAYVVGAEANDINPTTGLPEFFLKKLFKKIGKAIKKVVKAVVKVVKKVAPIILPIAMPFLLPALGPMYGAALGSGIGTLIGGGSIKDALKSALVAGAVGGITGGFTGDKGSFMANVADAANPQRLAQGFSNLGEGLTSGSFQGFRDAIGKDFQAVTDVTSSAAASSQVIQSGDTLSQIAQQNNTTVEALMKANPQITDPNVIIAGESINIPPAAGGTGTTTLTEKVIEEGGKDAAGDVAERSILEKTGDVMFRGGQTPTEIATAQTKAGEAYLADMAKAGITPTEAGLKAAQAAAGPGMLARFGPTALAGTAVMAGTGMFDVPEMEQANFLDYNPDGSPVTGRDLIDQDPGKYLVHNLGQIQLNEETGEYEPVGQETTTEEEAAYLPPVFQPVIAPPPVNESGYLMASNPGGPFARPYVTQAAEGGPIFPRRTGGIAPTEGTPGEDSVRAMLMPGEFVMTTDAVRGLGNGNLNNGIKNMYSVMRNLERRGRAMA